ncbi:hypothetical protein [Lacticaseibacillus parakribbianus]|uniref:hypothetical protein n=1 Tax=Lacticaseibacillus parakribbianus TaxID=2970927 RepID=UPI0021CB7AEF|nr:hypothetical protein [Lacticaseibacillus parakribbianus]
MPTKLPTSYTPHGQQTRCPNPRCKRYVKATATVCPSCGTRLRAPRKASYRQPAPTGNWFTNLSLTAKIAVVVGVLIVLRIVLR